MQSTKNMPFKSKAPNYIAASYIKYLESAGARVVPISNKLTEEETEDIFYSINGALFPGGNVELQDSGYAVTARRILKLAMQAHSKGKYFPIWGTCLGHEFLAAYVANATGDVLSYTDSINITLTMKFAKGYEKSRLFRSIPPFLKSYLSKVPATANFHHFSVTSETYKNNKKLTDFFQVLSTSVDRKGVEFISTMEAKNYPIFSTQWHPERNAFEWYLKYRDNHEQGGILVTQYMANFFVSQTRLNHNKFESREKKKQH